MKYYRITARSKIPCNEIDENKFIIDFKNLLREHGIESVHINIFKNDNK